MSVARMACCRSSSRSVLRTTSMAGLRQTVSQASARQYHTHSVAYTWRTAMRPDLKTTPKFWDLPWEDPVGMKIRKESMRWWKRTHTDRIAEKLSNDLKGGGTARRGIILKLLTKAYKPEHIRAALQGLGWVQARFNKDMGVEEASLLMKAAARARSPDMIAELFESMSWLRIWPQTSSFNYLFDLFAEESERETLLTPPMHVPQYDTDVVHIEKVETKKKEPVKKLLIKTRFQKDAEEEKPKEEKQKKVVIPPLVVFPRIYRLFTSDRFKLHPDADTHRLLLRYYAFRRDFNAARVHQEQLEKLGYPNLQHDVFLMSHLADDNVKEARAIWETKIAPQIDPTQIRSGLTLGQRRAGIALMLALNREDDAYKLLKEDPIREENLQTHLGKPERVATLRTFYERLASEGVQIPAEFSDFLGRFDSVVNARLAKQEHVRKIREDAAKRKEQKQAQQAEQSEQSEQAEQTEEMEATA